MSLVLMLVVTTAALFAMDALLLQRFMRKEGIDPPFSSGSYDLSTYYLQECARRGQEPNLERIRRFRRLRNLFLTMLGCYFALWVIDSLLTLSP